MVPGLGGILQVMKQSRGLLSPDLRVPVLNPRPSGIQLPPIDTPPISAIEPGPPPGLFDRMKSGLGEAFNTYFGGMDDPELSDAENERARKAAMLKAGISMMHMANSGGSFGDALTAGGMAGVQSGRAERDALLERQMEEERERQRAQMARMMSPLMGMGQSPGASPELRERAMQRMGQSILLSPTSMSNIASPY